jgi:hypothetical protein
MTRQCGAEAAPPREWPQQGTKGAKTPQRKTFRALAHPGGRSLAWLAVCVAGSLSRGVSAPNFPVIQLFDHSPI